jgi:hypothetical protein
MVSAGKAAVESPYESLQGVLKAIPRMASLEVDRNVINKG